MRHSNFPNASALVFLLPFFALLQFLFLRRQPPPFPIRRVLLEWEYIALLSGPYRYPASAGFCSA